MRLPTRVIAQRQQWSCMRRRSCSLCSLRETTTSPFLCWQPPRHKITQATFRLLYVYSPPFSASTQSVSGVSSLICGRKKGTARFATELALRISKGKQWMKKCEVGFYFFYFCIVYCGGAWIRTNFPGNRFVSEGVQASLACVNILELLESRGVQQFQNQPYFIVLWHFFLPYSTVR